MVANDDEFISNIALIESVKNCSILWYSRIEDYKDTTTTTTTTV